MLKNVKVRFYLVIATKSNINDENNVSKNSYFDEIILSAVLNTL